MNFQEYSNLVPHVDINWFPFQDNSLEDYRKRISLARELRVAARRYENDELAALIDIELPEMEFELSIRQHVPEKCKNCPGLSMTWVQDHPGELGCDPEISPCEFN